MVMEFPGDPTTYSLDRQYMFGPSLLVAPVFSRSGEVSYYLPAGVWTNFFTGESVAGGSWRKETVPFDSVPLWVRDGSVLVTNPGHDSAVYEYGKDALVSVFLNGDSIDSASATVSEEDGSSVVFSASRGADGAVSVSSSDGREFRARLGITGETVASQGGRVVLK
jgi:alpha-D-xyloside xylohydrolase